MSRRYPGTGSSRVPVVGALGRTDSVDRASVVGSAPVVAGTGFVLSRAVAMVVAGGSGLTFLWGLVIGLGFATAGVVVLASSERTGDRMRTGRSPVERIPLTTAGGVLLLSLLTGVVLGTVL